MKFTLSIKIEKASKNLDNQNKIVYDENHEKMETILQKHGLSGGFLPPELYSERIQEFHMSMTVRSTRFTSFYFPGYFMARAFLACVSCCRNSRQNQQAHTV